MILSEKIFKCLPVLEGIRLDSTADKCRNFKRTVGIRFLSLKCFFQPSILLYSSRVGFFICSFISFVPMSLFWESSFLWTLGGVGRNKSLLYIAELHPCYHSSKSLLNQWYLLLVIITSRLKRSRIAPRTPRGKWVIFRDVASAYLHFWNLMKWMERNNLGTTGNMVSDSSISSGWEYFRNSPFTQYRGSWPITLCICILLILWHHQQALYKRKQLP